MDVKSDRNFQRVKYKFEFCGSMFSFEPEVAVAYDGIDLEASMGRDSENKFFVCVIFFLELENLILWRFRIVW
jgi:hypothetical protein